MCSFVNGFLHLAKCFQNMWMSSVLCSFLLPNTISLSGWSSFYLRHSPVDVWLLGCVSVLVHIWTLTSVQTHSHFSWMGMSLRMELPCYVVLSPLRSTQAIFQGSCITYTPVGSACGFQSLSVLVGTCYLLCRIRPHGVKCLSSCLPFSPRVQCHRRSFSCPFVLCFVSLENCLLDLLLVL